MKPSARRPETCLLAAGTVKLDHRVAMPLAASIVRSWPESEGRIRRRDERPPAGVVRFV